MTNSFLFLYVTIFSADAKTQIILKNSFETSFTLSFNSWSTDRKSVDTQLDYEVDIGSAQNIISPKYIIVAQQTAATIQSINKAYNAAVFDNLNVRKHHFDIDGVRCSREARNIGYASNNYADQYGDLEIFYKTYFGEELHNPIIR